MRYLEIVGKGKAHPRWPNRHTPRLRLSTLLRIDSRPLRTIGPLDKDVQEALAIIRGWEKKQDEWLLR